MCVASPSGTAEVAIRKVRPTENDNPKLEEEDIIASVDNQHTGCIIS